MTEKLDLHEICFKESDLTEDEYLGKMFKAVQSNKYVASTRLKVDLLLNVEKSVLAFHNHILACLAAASYGRRDHLDIMQKSLLEQKDFIDRYISFTNDIFNEVTAKEAEEVKH